MSVSSAVDMIMFGEHKNENDCKNLRSKLGNLEGALKLRDKMIREQEFAEPMIGEGEGALSKNGHEQQDEMEVEEHEESTEASVSEDDAFVEVESSDDGTEVSRSF